MYRGTESYPLSLVPITIFGCGSFRLPPLGLHYESWRAVAEGGIWIVRECVSLQIMGRAVNAEKAPEAGPGHRAVHRAARSQAHYIFLCFLGSLWPTAQCDWEGFILKSLLSKKITFVKGRTCSMGSKWEEWGSALGEVRSCCLLL